MENSQDFPIAVRLTVIIPTYNRPVSLIDTVRGYCAGRCVPEEIIVVDQSQEPVDFKEVDLPSETSLKLIRCEEPSLTKARNVGARQASNDIILFSDDDVLVNHDSIAILAAIMNDSSIALVAGVDLSDNAIHGNPKLPTLQGSVGGVVLGLKKPWRTDGYVVKTTMRGRYPQPVFGQVRTEWAMGYFFCVRKSFMERWHVWFDEALKRYAYAEDLDFSMRYCYQAKREGLKSVLEPAIFVQHLASKEWRTPTDEAVRYFVRNRRYLSRKLFPRKGWYRVAMLVFDSLFALAWFPRDKVYSLSLLRAIYGRSSR